MTRALDLTGWHQPPPGRLLVLERVENGRSGKARWRCLCDCGTEIITYGYYLTSGDTRSCGCLHRETAAAQGRKKLINLRKGKRFGRLKILKRAESAENGDSRWLCRCDCGNETVSIGRQLRSGRARSCGCLNNELMVARAPEVGAIKRLRHCVICGRFYRAIGPGKYCRRKCYNVRHRQDESLRRQELAGINLAREAAALAAQLKERIEHGANKS